MEPFVERQASELLWYEIPSWVQMDKQLTVGFSSRVGGMSTAPWDSLNCGLHVGDDPLHVIANRRRLAAAAGFSFAAWTCAEQVHGSEVQLVTVADKGSGSLSRMSAIQGKDALITKDEGIVLTSLYADCVPLYFFDPVRRVIGLAHAGWKGTVAKIAAVTIAGMVEQLGCQLHDVRAMIGPSIGACCYEVDDIVIQHVTYSSWSSGVIAKGNGKYWLDLKEINRQIMIEAGILPVHIEISNHCTACHTDRFFSHRKEQGKTGRMVSWIGLKVR